MDDYESVLCVKNEVFVYRIPARPSNRGYRAADWKLDAPDWTGRLKVVAKGKQCLVRMDDKISGDLFAECPVENYPSVAVEQVVDSSRYFVLRIQDPSGRHAFIGIGFADRGDSFDLIVALQDHFKQLKREEGAAQAAIDLSSGPKLDLRFKEGQTIKININTRKGDDDEDSVQKKRSRAGNMGGGLLPPPPGGVKIAPPRPSPQQAPPAAAAFSGFSSAPAPAPVAASSSSFFPSTTTPTATSGGSSNLDLLLDFGGPSSSSTSAPPPAAPSQPASDPWGDFASASFGNSAPQQQPAPSNNDGGWVNFN